MGYTHYWEVKKSLSQTEWDKFYIGVNKILEKNGVPIQYEYDNPKPPQIDDNIVRFNGVGDEGHETFYFEKEKTGFNFCKTAQKPYDIVVVACLIYAKICFGDKIRISSDGEVKNWNGEIEAWQDGKKLFEKAIGVVKIKFETKLETSGLVVNIEKPFIEKEQKENLPKIPETKEEQAISLFEQAIKVLES